VLAYRRSTGVHRQQLKWLMNGGAIALIGLLASPAGRRAVVAVIAPSISIVSALLRYRLYEESTADQPHALLRDPHALLVGVFMGLIALTNQRLRSPAASAFAASTLAAAAPLHPLRKRIQRLCRSALHTALATTPRHRRAFTARLRDGGRDRRDPR